MEKFFVIAIRFRFFGVGFGSVSMIDLKVCYEFRR